MSPIQFRYAFAAFVLGACLCAVPYCLLVTSWAVTDQRLKQLTTRAEELACQRGEASGETCLRPESARAGQLNEGNLNLTQGKASGQTAAGLTLGKDRGFACCSRTETYKPETGRPSGRSFTGRWLAASVGSTQGESPAGAERTLNPLGEGWPPSDFAGSGDIGRSVGVPGPHHLVFGVGAARKDVPQLLHIGARGRLEGVRAAPREPSQAGIKPRRLLHSQDLYNVSAYSHGCILPRSGKEGPPQRAADGSWPVSGKTVAADWRIHPPGSELIIAGRVWRVTDKGRAIKGRRIDLFLGSCHEARAWGRRMVSVVAVPAASHKGIE